MMMQNSRDVARTEIQNTVRSAVRGDKGGDARGSVDQAPDAPPRALPPIPEGGGRFTIDKDGDRTTVTTAPLPPEFMVLTQRAEETAFGLMGLLAAIIILGPFARMFARRMERRPAVQSSTDHSLALQQQLLQLQQSVDAMSVEIERVGEAQRFQSKALLAKDAS